MQYKCVTKVNADRSDVFKWFERRGSFRRLMPPWEIAEEVRSDENLQNGAKRIFRFPLGPVKMTWVAEHLGYQPPEKFEDVMVKGPFKSWHHKHHFEDRGDGQCHVIDDVEYKLPMGLPGRLVAGRSIKKRLDRMFRARSQRLIRDMGQHEIHRDKSRKRILIAGASGLIGKQLVAFLDTGGHDIWRLVRHKHNSENQEIFWNPKDGVLNPKSIEGFDVVIHLGGAGIGDKRWSKSRMKIIESSRKESTTLLAETLANLSNKPELFMVASAIGWYGDRGDEILTEESESGTGYLPDVCAVWESSAIKAKNAGIRTIHLRTGVVLDATGGALAKMLLPAKLGVGGPIGRGRQWLSWISMDDEIYAIHHLLMTHNTEGIYNIVSPNPVKQKQFAKGLGRVLRRPAFIPTPPFGVWLLFGKMGVALTTESQRVTPNRLLDSGYKFQHENLDGALRDTLGMW